MTDQDRVWLTRELVRGLGKALARNEQDRAEFVGLLKGYLKRHGPVRLEVAGRSLRCGGETIKDESGRTSALALSLVTGGIRDVTIEAGATDEEIGQVLATFEEANAGARLLDAGYAHVDVGTFSFADRLERPAGLSTEGETLLANLRKRAEVLAKDFEAHFPPVEGGHELELSDGGGELARLARVTGAAAGEVGVPDVPRDELLAFRARALEASQPGKVLLELANVVIDGLALDPEALGAENGRWFLEAAPALALRRGDLSLLAALLERYQAELTASGGAVAAAVRSVISGLDSKDGLEKLVAIGTSATAEGGPAAFCTVLEALGEVGVGAAITAYRRTSSKELRDALGAYLAENIAHCPDALRPLLEPAASAETAKWALFLVSKSLKGASSESLLEAGKRHPQGAVSEYAVFLWKTQTQRGRLTALLESLEKDDVAERVRAVGALAKARDQEALAPLLKLVDDPTFLSRPAEEMNAFMSAIAEIGGKEMIHFFEKQSERSSGIFKLRAGNEVREQAKVMLKKLVSERGAS